MLYIISSILYIMSSKLYVISSIPRPSSRHVDAFNGNKFRPYVWNVEAGRFYN